MPDRRLGNHSGHYEGFTVLESCAWVPDQYPSQAFSIDGFPDRGPAPIVVFRRLLGLDLGSPLVHRPRRRGRVQGHAGYQEQHE